MFISVRYFTSLASFAYYFLPGIRKLKNNLREHHPDIALCSATLWTKAIGFTVQRSVTI